MPAASLTPAGPFSLAASIRFLEGFTPAAHDQDHDRVLRLAFPADDAHGVIGCALRQKEAAAGGPPAPVRAEFTVHPGPDATPAGAARAQIARIVSLDVDGSGFAAVGEHDPVVASLLAQYPGLRPVLFCSPYEAAAWAVIGHRVRMTQAAAVKARIARDHGRAVDVAGRRLHAFPTPEALRRLRDVPGLTDVKVARLHAIAEAALDGELDAGALRALPADEALRTLRRLPGIGPFSAELVLIRGAGHPDVFPVTESRLHRAMATEYGLDAAAAGDPAALAGIADGWRPFRSWVGLLLRARAQERGPAR
ncbi:DNA-3-methyladenine glycosylase 2 family protein [Streptomyces griseoviridis]|uniref:DNA-3-methyladenine glycosylase II n=1 Tax=Streptomyces griseoviridis TaxID=45398 RepID=A0A3S9ZNP3_STRGD|nr:DNA-3-methyladenine glycosylase [Streptomyces griseoviridis]AZS89515.1 DNA-3-methyladenine glycosylase 2 family protein [Streptomyces griseoviridis]QCN83646.1 Fe-S cluster assembly protein HesB [Streptomyces griseoviridis]